MAAVLRRLAWRRYRANWGTGDDKHIAFREADALRRAAKRLSREGDVETAERIAAHAEAVERAAAGEPLLSYNNGTNPAAPSADEPPEVAEAFAAIDRALTYATEYGPEEMEPGFVAPELATVRAYAGRLKAERDEAREQRGADMVLCDAIREGSPEAAMAYAKARSSTTEYDRPWRRRTLDSFYRSSLTWS